MQIGRAVIFANIFSYPYHLTSALEPSGCKPLTSLGVQQSPQCRKSSLGLTPTSLTLLAFLRGWWSSVPPSQWRLSPLTESNSQSHYSSGHCTQARRKMKKTTDYPVIKALFPESSVPGLGWEGWCLSSGLSCFSPRTPFSRVWGSIFCGV